MGIGSIQVVGKGDPFTGCEFNDSHGGCGVVMWDNETDSNISMNISVDTCIQLRNYLNLYIERYVNCIDEDV